MLYAPAYLRYALLMGLLAVAAPAAVAQNAPGTPASAAQIKDGAFRRAGKLYQLRAGQTTLLTTPMRFPNGLTLRPDGIMISKNGSRQLLENGKAVNMQGDVVLYRDDMMTPEAISRHDEATTGAAGTTTVSIPAATNLAALAPELQRTAQRLEQLRQLSALLDERATAAAAGTAPLPELETRIQQLSQQLQP